MKTEIGGMPTRVVFIFATVLQAMWTGRAVYVRIKPKRSIKKMLVNVLQIVRSKSDLASWKGFESFG